MSGRVGNLLLGIAAIGAVGGAGYYFYRKDTEKDRIIQEKERIIAALAQKLDRSWAEEMIADVRVDSVDENAPSMSLTFVQYQPGTEKATLKRSMTLPGREFYIDALVVKFDRKLVEEGDGLRGKSLLLFRRAFGDRQKPIDGVPLFRTGIDSLVPEAMQIDAAPTKFEQDLWARFWGYANDPKAASEAGIRVAQGEAPHVKAVVGQVYKLTLRASGGLDITPRLPAAMVGGGAQDAGSGG